MGKKLLYNLEVSEKVLVLAPEYPLVCKILGSVVKEQLRKINPARVRYTEFKPYTVDLAYVTHFS